MTFKELKKQIKEELKARAHDIKIGKPLRKPSNRTAETPKSHFKAWDALWSNQRMFRHQHIAYCEYFNKTPRSMIEMPDIYNKPSQKMIDKFKMKWMAIKLDKVEEKNEELEAA